MDNVVPFPGTDSERKRRAFLACVEEALLASGSGDLVCEYRLIPPMPGVGGPLFTGLVVTCPRVAGEVRVVALSLVRHVVSTFPGAGPADLPPEVQALAEQLRRWGIAGVAGDERRYDPFPGDGQPTYELTVVAPPGAGAAPDTDVSDGQPIEWHTSPDAAEIARRIQAWRDAAVLTYPPGPRDPSSLAPLRAIAQARRALLAAVDRGQVESLRQRGQLGEAWRLAGLHTALDPDRLEQPGVQVAPGDRERLRADLAALLPVHLQWHYLRDDRGRLALGENVLLAAYESATPLSQGRHLWLTAASPARRRDPQVVTLQLAALIGENHTHVWTEAPWLWDARAQDASRARRWGVEDLPLARLGLAGGGGALLDAPVDAVGTLSEGERAARCIALQDAGRLREALALYEVELDERVGRLLDGLRIKYQAAHEIEPWARATQEALRRAALWRWGPLLRDAAAARERWVAEKRSRRWSAPMLRLFWLPHQTQQAKAAVMLRARERDGSGPRLELESSANNARLPVVAWQRPLEIDLVRFGLLAEAELPSPQVDYPDSPG